MFGRVSLAYFPEGKQMSYCIGYLAATILVWSAAAIHPPSISGGKAAAAADGDLLGAWLVAARAPQWFWPLVGASFAATHPWVAIHLRDHKA